MPIEIKKENGSAAKKVRKLLGKGKAKVKLATAVLVVACAAAAIADATWTGAASQAWVSNYVGTAIACINTRTAVTNGVSLVAAGDIVMAMEPNSDAAMIARNSVTPAVTNGTVFVWNGRGAYINPLGTITCTATNLVYGGVGSTYANGLLRFAGRFDALPALIQPSASYAITNAIQEVTE